MTEARVQTAALSHLEWGVLCRELHDRVVSPAARDRLCTEEGDPDPEALLPRALEPMRVEAQLQALDGLELALEAATELDTERVSVSAELLAVVDIRSILRRAAKETVLDVGELCAVTDAVEAAGRIAGMFAAISAAISEHQMHGRAPSRRAAFTALRADLRPLSPPAQLAETLVRSLNRQGEPRLADAASDVLGRLRTREKQSRRALVTAAERLLKRQGLKRALADNYWTERDGRVVLPVRSDGFSRVGGQGTVSGIIHGASGSGQTLFVEPSELVDDNNAVREAMTAVRSEERRILQRLSRNVGEEAQRLEASLDAAIALDHLHARLRLCRDLGATAPTVNTPRLGLPLSLPEARHPLMLLAGTQVVPNDLRVDVGTGLVLSGPNAGGKTVALKTVGLCVLMAQAGLRIPTALGARVPLFSCVVTDVGDDQSISANLSTFSAHIGHVLEAFAAAQLDDACPLVLLDEVAVGTDPDQGAALAEAILLGLVDAGATLVVTTHYERLKLLATSDGARFVNGAVGFDLDRLRPTFRVRIGAPGSSSALAVARRLGVPEAVLDRAESLLADSRVRVDALLQEVEAERERLRQERESLDRELRGLREERAAIENREARAETSASVRREKAHDAATSQLRALEDAIKDRRKQLRRQGAPQLRDGPGGSGVTDPDARAFARNARGKLDEQRPPSDRTPETGDAPASLAVGDRVKVLSLDAKGDVVAVKGEKVTVQVGAIKTTVAFADLRLVASQRNPRPQPAAPRKLAEPDYKRFFGADAQVVEAGIENVADLRGVRADEALTMVEVFLDRALGEDREIVILKHGYGSGALRRAVREHLPRLEHVVRHRPGLPAEGGDAVTVVWVRS